MTTFLSPGGTDVWADRPRPPSGLPFSTSEPGFPWEIVSSTRTLAAGAKLLSYEGPMAQNWASLRLTPSPPVPS